MIKFVPLDKFASKLESKTLDELKLFRSELRLGAELSKTTEDMRYFIAMREMVDKEIEKRTIIIKD